MSKNLLLIFTRNPELGKCKTRLAKTIGNENALEVYKLLLQHTVAVTSKVNCKKNVYYSVKIRENDNWNSSIYSKKQQVGNDLGERMQNAFLDGFNENFDKIIIIGSDLFDLKPNHITNAFDKLDNNDVVFGPAKDGGFYLLGMKNLHQQLFKNKIWGTDTVLADSLSDLKNNSVYLLEELNDIDVYDDMKHYDEFKHLTTNVND